MDIQLFPYATACKWPARHRKQVQNIFWRKEIVKKLCVTLSMLFCLNMSTAQAEEFRPYAGVGLGIYGMKVNGAGVGTKTAFGGFGQLGVDYGDYFGAELRFGASSNASFTASNVKQEIQVSNVFSFLAKIQLPVNERLRIYALVGGSSGEAKAKITTPGFVYVATGTNMIKDSETSASYGGGVEFKAYDQWRVGVEYMKYFQDVYGVVGTVKYSF